MKLLRIFLLAILCAAPFHVGAQPKQTPPASKTPTVVAEFVQLAGPHPTAEVFFDKAQEALWKVYPHNQSLKSELIAYIQSGPEGPGLGFAAIALIPFHDPASVAPVLDRALDRKISPATRFALLNSAPYILSMGDVWPDSEGQLDADTRDFIKQLKEAANRASQEGVGHFHARELREVFDTSQRDKMEDDDLGLIYLHLSAYLVGTLDLKDYPVLEPMLDPKEGSAFVNLMVALSFSANRNFLERLQSLEQDQITPKEEQAAASAAGDWWREYLSRHPDGDWLPAALGGMRDAGFDLQDDLHSVASSQQLMRAFDSENSIVRYNAYRILNRAYRTHFDLEAIFQPGKYALSFLDPNPGRERNEQRLKSYWQQRLSTATN